MKLIRLLGFILLLFVFAGCGPTVHIEKAGNINLSKYRTFAWAQRDRRDVRVDMAEQRIKDAVNAELVRTQGWREVRRNPDVILSYDVLVERGKRVQSEPVYSWGGFRTFYNPYSRRFFRVYYPQQFIGYDNYTVPIKEATITISMIDTRTDQVIWQGWAADEIDSRRMTAREAERIVKAIFRKWETIRR